MAYTDDSVLARLSALNDSHDSIATAAQWIMFHRYVLSHVERCSLTTSLQTPCRSNGSNVATTIERFVSIQALKLSISSQW